MSAKKGQAAMEYLMTYGWALVALVVVIGAIMATGVFNPSYLIAEECTLQPDLACTGHLLYIDEVGTPQLGFRINNGLGYDIRLTGVKIIANDGTTYEGYSYDLMIPQGTDYKIDMALDELSATKGETEKLRVSINYVSCAPEVNPDCGSDGPEHTISGRIVAHVEEA